MSEREDLVGQKFNRLTLTLPTDESGGFLVMKRQLNIGGRECER